MCVMFMQYDNECCIILLLIHDVYIGMSVYPADQRPDFWKLQVNNYYTTLLHTMCTILYSFYIHYYTIICLGFYCDINLLSNIPCYIYTVYVYLYVNSLIILYALH